jgi:hypothetical protein
MKTILHQMTLLGDQLTDRDRTEHFMASLVHKSYLVKKIDLSGTFDQACRDIEDFISIEKMMATIIKQHHHNLPPGVVTLNNVEGEEFDFDSDQETTYHSEDKQRRGTSSTSGSPPAATPRCDWCGGPHMEERCYRKDPRNFYTFPLREWHGNPPPLSVMNNYCRWHPRNPNWYQPKTRPVQQSQVISQAHEDWKSPLSKIQEGGTS